MLGLGLSGQPGPAQRLNSALWSGAAGDRPYDRAERLRDLQLLVCPVSGEGGQQAVAIAVNAEHGARGKRCS